MKYSLTHFDDNASYEISELVGITVWDQGLVGLNLELAVTFHAATFSQVQEVRAAFDVTVAEIQDFVFFSAEDDISYENAESLGLLEAWVIDKWTPESGVLNPLAVLLKAELTQKLEGRAKILKFSVMTLSPSEPSLQVTV